MAKVTQILPAIFVYLLISGAILLLSLYSGELLTLPIWIIANGFLFAILYDEEMIGLGKALFLLIFMNVIGWAFGAWILRFCGFGIYFFTPALIGLGILFILIASAVGIKRLKNKLLHK